MNRYMMLNSGLLHTVASKDAGLVLFLYLHYAIKGSERPFIRCWISAVVFLVRWMPGSSVNPMTNGCCDWNALVGSNQRLLLPGKTAVLTPLTRRDLSWKCAQSPYSAVMVWREQGRWSRMLGEIPSAQHRLELDFNKMALLLACFLTHFSHSTSK